MPDLLDALKLVAQGISGSTTKADTLTGTVVSLSPLAIKVSDKITLMNDDPLQQTVILSQRATKSVYKAVLTLPTEVAATITIDGEEKEAVIKVEQPIRDATITFSDAPIQQGDKVILQRSAGGQTYNLIDKVV